MIDPPQWHLDNDLVGSGLLVLLAEDVDVPAGLVGSVGDVEAAGLLADCGHSIHFLWGELNLLKVRNNTIWRNALWDDTVAADLRPGEDDLSGGDFLAESLGGVGGDGLDLVVFDQEGETEHVVTEGLYS
jgi:hypothetical protein